MITARDALGKLTLAVKQNEHLRPLIKFNPRLRKSIENRMDARELSILMKLETYK